MMKFTLILLLAIPAVTLQAQNTIAQRPAMDNIMRSNGRIFVVVAVMLIILAGLVLYLLRIDSKMTKIEKEIKIDG